MRYDAEHFCSHAGLKDNPAIAPEEIAALERALAHDEAQLLARRDGAFTAPTGLALKFDPGRHYEAMTDDEVRAYAEVGRAFAGVDFGAWRFAWLLLIADRLGRVRVVDEIFSQREELEVRAYRVVRRLESLKVNLRTFQMWGDVANTQDIIELNAALRRLSKTGRATIPASGSSPEREAKLTPAQKKIAKAIDVMPVEAEKKARAASVERLNDLLARNALLVRRNLADRQVWRLGQNASSDGQPVVGSRLTWEIGAWCYPEPKEGKEQKQDPEDATADGADAIAALRYAVMSWWAAAGYKIPRSKFSQQPGMERRATVMQGKIPERKKVRGGSRKKTIRHPELGRMW